MQLSEGNVILVKNKLHAQFSQGVEPQNGSGWIDIAIIIKRTFIIKTIATRRTKKKVPRIRNRIKDGKGNNL